MHRTLHKVTYFCRAGSGALWPKGSGVRVTTPRSVGAIATKASGISSSSRCIRLRQAPLTTLPPLLGTTVRNARRQQCTRPFTVSSGRLQASGRGMAAASGSPAAVAVAGSNSGGSGGVDVPEDVAALLSQILAKQQGTVVYATGGGAAALSWLLATPGASSVLLEASVPYAPLALQQLLEPTAWQQSAHLEEDQGRGGEEQQGGEFKERQQPGQQGRGAEEGRLAGGQPAAASAEVASRLAAAAYRRAAALAPLGVPLVGLGATCALATNRTKQGDHKVFVATHTAETTHIHSLVLAKGARTRSEEEGLASRLLLQALAVANGVPPAPPPEQRQSAGEGLLTGLLVDGDSGVQVTETARGDPLHELINGRVCTLEYSAAGQRSGSAQGQASGAKVLGKEEGSGDREEVEEEVVVVVDAPRPGRVYLPGSFNPLHEGHEQMLRAAEQTSGKQGIYELSIGNADKGLMAEEEIQRRVRQFTSRGLPVVVTQAPLFTQKAELFPGSSFVVGYDTAVRLVKPEYYGDETAMLLQFARLVYRGCSFLVAGRVEEGEGGSSFRTLSDVQVPPSLARGRLFEGIPEDLFRNDVSSTLLRKQGRGLTFQGPG